jgi:hypothetical protein
MPSFRSSTIAARRHRIVSGENGSVNGISFRLREQLALAQDAVVPRRRLDGEADRLEAADELAHVLPHLRPGTPVELACQLRFDWRSRRAANTPSCGRGYPSR